MKQEYVDCFDLFEFAENVVVLTGAGISTLSGIPDYRGKSGLDSKKELFEGYNRGKITDIDFAPKHPDIFYRYARKYIYPMLDKAPSVGHITLAELQKRGIIDKLYTQNIDTLHTKAGSKTYELHGSLVGHTCMKCGLYGFTTTEIRSCIEHGGIPYCSCGGLIKPDVIFFGEELNEEMLSQAFNDFMSADIILVIGSSLTVPPVSTLPMAVSLNHAKLIIVNEQPGALFVFMGFIEMLSSFPACISMRLSNSSAKMECNSRLDDKITACGENQKWQSVTPQYRFNFQKFSDFLQARTQNVHLTVLYYGKSTKILGVDNGNFRRTIRNGASVNATIEECGTSGITPLLYTIDHTSIFDINKRRQNEY